MTLKTVLLFLALQNNELQLLLLHYIQFWITTFYEFDLLRTEFSSGS